MRKAFHAVKVSASPRPLMPCPPSRWSLLSSPTLLACCGGRLVLRSSRLWPYLPTRTTPAHLEAGATDLFRALDAEARFVLTLIAQALHGPSWTGLSRG